jgi:hypothetical protein
MNPDERPVIKLSRDKGGYDDVEQLDARFLVIGFVRAGKPGN